MKMIRELLRKYNSIPITAKATIWFIFCSTLQKCISLITTPIFTRIMSNEQFGQFSIYNSWLQILTIITTLRLNYAVFNKGMSRYKNDRDGYTATMQSLTFVITLFVFGLYLIFRRQVNDLTELPTFIMIAIFAELLVTPAIDFWTIRKRYEYIYKPVVFRTVAMALLNAVLGVIAVYMSEEKGYARIISCIIVSIVFGVSLFIYNRKQGKTWFKREYAQFAILFNLPLLLHYLSLYILDQFDRIMIQKMDSIAAVGIYSVAYSAGLLMKIITQSVNSALVPWQYEKLEKREFKCLDNTLFSVFALIGACSLLFSAFAPELMKILADEQYYQAIYVIPPVALSMFFTFEYTTFANAEFYFDQNKFTMYVSVSGALLNVVLNYIGIKIFGYIAAAYTTLICYVVFTVSHYIYMSYSIKKTLDIDRIFDAKRLVILNTVVLCCGTLMIFMYRTIVVRYIVIVGFVGILFVNRKKVMDVFSAVRKKNR